MSTRYWLSFCVWYFLILFLSVTRIHSLSPICYLYRIGLLSLLSIFYRGTLHFYNYLSTSMPRFQPRLLDSAPAWWLNFVTCSSGSLVCVVPRKQRLVVFSRHITIFLNSEEYYVEVQPSASFLLERLLETPRLLYWRALLRVFSHRERPFPVSFLSSLILE